MATLDLINVGSLPNDNTGDVNRVAYQKTNTNLQALNDDITAIQEQIGDVSGTSQPLDSDLTAISAITTTGMMARTATATYAMRTITGTSGQVTLTNGNGVSGNPTVSLANSGVTAASYTRANITVDAFGRITSASNGTTDITLDTAPVIGGNLDVGSFSIISSGNADITINPAGSGEINLQAPTVITGATDITGAATITGTMTFAGTLGLTGDLNQTGDLRVTGNQLITSTNAGSGFGPHIDLHRNSTSPAANDVIGQISFSGEDSASNKTEYGRINTVIATATNGSEDGTLVLESITGGSYPSVPQLQINARPVCTGVATSALIVDRRSDDGVIVSIRQNDSAEGDISVSGSTVSFNGLTGSHYAEWATDELKDNPPPRGTWLETTDTAFEIPGDGYSHEGLCLVRVAQPGSKCVAGVYLDDFKDEDGTRRGILVAAIGGPFMVRFTGPAPRGSFVDISSSPGVAKAQSGNYLTVNTCAKIWRGDSDTGERAVSVVFRAG